METKINLLLKNTTSLIILFVSNLLFAQNYSSYNYARLYTLERCLDINYASLDSSFTKKNPDITDSLVLQSLSPEQMSEIDKIVKEKAGNFYKEPPYGAYDNSKANQICFFVGNCTNQSK